MKQLNIFNFFLVLALVFSLESCQRGEGVGTFAEVDEQPISNWLAEQEQYTLWVEMMNKADIFNALNLPKDYTLFVADNKAVEEYFTNHPEYSSYNEMSISELNILLRYHIIEGALFNQEELYLKLPLANNSGFYLTAGIDVDKNLRYIDNGVEKEKSYIISGNHEVNNGIVHQIDKLLQPLTKPIYEELASDSVRYSIFTKLIKYAEMEDWYTKRWNKNEEVSGVEWVEEKTLFVVSDSILAEFGITTLEELLDSISSEGFDKKKRAIAYLNYHTLEGSVGYGELVSFIGEEKSKNIFSYSEEALIAIEDFDSKVWINRMFDSTQLIDDRRDIPTFNGYIHEVNTLMKIPNLKASGTITYEPTAHDAFRKIPFYRAPKKVVDITEVYDLTKGEMPYITWSSVPESAARVWYESRDVGNPVDRFMHDDGINADLGAIGWIEFTIPTLPMGKYKVELIRRVEKGNGGQFRAYINGREPIANKTFNCGDENYKSVLIAGAGNKNFFEVTTIGSHTIRMVVAGIGPIGVDRFIFIAQE